MNKPTILSPWFVVVKMQDEYCNACEEPSDYPCGVELLWYVAPEEDGDIWNSDRKKAMLFNSIHSAHRVARAEGAYAVVVANEEDLKEYRDA